MATFDEPALDVGRDRFRRGLVVSVAGLIGSVFGEFYTLAWLLWVTPGDSPSPAGGSSMDPGVPIYPGWQVTAVQWLLVVFFAVALMGFGVGLRRCWRHPAVRGTRRRPALLGLLFGVLLGAQSYVIVSVAAQWASDHTTQGREELQDRGLGPAVDPAYVP